MDIERSLRVARHGCLVALLGLAMAGGVAAQPVVVSDAVQVASGTDFACMLSQGGAVRCWGSDLRGQLGDPDFAFEQPLPRDVFGMDSGIQSIAAGNHHACALDSAGGVRCWGANGAGQLGDGSLTNRHQPVAVDGLSSGVQSLALGGDFSCAVLSGGGVKCWGRNHAGQLGRGDTVDSAIPVDVSGLGNATAVALGLAHACAATAAGGARCWGSNFYGALGDGSFVDSPVPVEVFPDGAGVQSVAAGDQTGCAILTGGELRCWGANFNGELGTGTFIGSGVPVAVTGMGSGVQKVALGSGLFYARNGGLFAGGISCAVMADTSLRCWGFGGRGALGIGSAPLNAGTPQTLADPATGTVSLDVSRRGGFACLTDNALGLRCWGANDSRQLGAGRGLRSLLPSFVADSVVEVAAGDFFSCSVPLGRSATECWGAGSIGQLGDGQRSSRPVPGAIQLSGTMSQLTTGSSHACVLADAQAYCWGANPEGQLGTGSVGPDSAPPMAVVDLDQPVQLAAGALHVCALEANGSVRCWGHNGAGEVGAGVIGGTVPAANPVPGLAGVSQIAAGGQFTCALQASGAVSCWGQGGVGQLGNGVASDSPSPVPVSGLQSGVVELAAGDLHACARLSDDSVRCWGAGSNGQLGAGNFNSSAVPVSPTGLPAASRVLAGGRTTAIIDSNGDLWVWGANSQGQYGDGTTTTRNVPVRSVFRPGPGGRVVFGEDHACGIDADAKLWCWGNNGDGQLGSARSGYSSSPIALLIDESARQVEQVTPTGDAASLAPRPSASGRFVVFQSQASTLTGLPDGNPGSDIFRRDLDSGTTELVSLADDPQDGDAPLSGDAIEPDVSADGALVVFVAPESAVAKVANESKHARDARMKGGGFGIFMRNMQTGRTFRVGSGRQDGQGSRPRIAPGGGAVVFTGPALPGEGSDGQDNVFRIPLQGGQPDLLNRRCVSCKAVSVAGFDTVEDADGESRNPVVSADGQWIAYETVSTNATVSQPSPCPAGNAQLMLRNMLTGVSRRVVPPPGFDPMACGTQGSSLPSIDHAARRLAFASDSALKPGSLAGMLDLHVVELNGGQITRVSETPSGAAGNGESGEPSLSGDGQTVAFVSAATDLDPASLDGNGVPDLFVARVGGRPKRLSRTAAGVEANGEASRPALDYNGKRAFFDSDASNLVVGDGNGERDVFQRAVTVNVDLLFRTGFE